MAAAENEVAVDPERFLRTYYDRWNLVGEVELHRKFLLLGPKGAGKSAAAHYLVLRWSKELGPESVFPTFLDFDDVNQTQSPLATLGKRLVGDVAALTDAAWRLFLSIRLLESLCSDMACDLAHDPQVIGLLMQLRNAGLASDDFPQVLRKVREKRGLIGAPKIVEFEGKWTETQEVNVTQLSEALVKIVARAKTPNRHILAVDGLDKAIGDNAAYWQTLAALVRVAEAMTRTLREGQHAYILVMCRSDVFRRVRFADSGKIAADGGIYMDWAAEAEDPRDVELWNYIASKAETEPDRLLSALPARIQVGQSRKMATDRYLLQITRYTPRDMTLLFKSLQERARDRTLTNSQVRRAADSFASRHLLTEIISEATGLLPELLIDRFEQIITHLPSRVFTHNQFVAALEAAGADATQTAVFGEYLFLQGAIGNYAPGVNYVQFYHRRDAHKFQPQGPWVLHTGLMYAFNKPWMLTDAAPGDRIGAQGSTTGGVLNLPSRGSSRARRIGYAGRQVDS
ncbi:P-loop ATPase, Sll1717 family [Pengzhenrongella frigida]|uniref:Uncharacterized protein n=1 Tax=Pengzhenrongella frigida TaxID=1259133 RepID=A0A4Q5N6H4_9MICO|nr:hypothetical protein [Cellulomonas sp. HLT2-17]RYV51851.1 hypothetical protein EUA98_06330 [Cellulomonas sp. HLT2-17]